MGTTPVVIINGAAGRMGATLVRLVQEDPALELGGVVERPGREGGLESLGCVVGTDMEEVMRAVPGAVVIDFTAPEASVAVARAAAATGTPVVHGTTGLKQEEISVLEECAKEVPLFWAPNMSVGVNVLVDILPRLVKMLGEGYDMEIMEIHHKMKKDSPSGTAVKLGQVMAEARGQKLEECGVYGREGIVGERTKEELGVMALRGGDVVGEHTAYFFGPGERIEVTHRAHSREVFAQGAIRAAKWIGKQQAGKLYSMQDMLRVG